MSAGLAFFAVPLVVDVQHPHRCRQTFYMDRRTVISEFMGARMRVPVGEGLAQN